jgi:hypothetical protein
MPDWDKHFSLYGIFIHYKEKVLKHCPLIATDNVILFLVVKIPLAYDVKTFSEYKIWASTIKHFTAVINSVIR